MNNEKQFYEISDAFLALRDIDDDAVENMLRENKKSRDAYIHEGKAYSVGAGSKDLEAARKFLDEDKEDGDEIEVIDVDADSVDHIKKNSEYVGQGILCCNRCKANRFIDMDLLVAAEGNEEVYNLEDECPHCHDAGAGYSLIGQVGKVQKEAPEAEAETEAEAEVENDAAAEDEATFENDLEDDAEEATDEETTEVEDLPDIETFEEEPEKDGMETDTSEDELDDLDLPDLGDEVDQDETEEDEDNVKESLTGDVQLNAMAEEAWMMNRVISSMNNEEAYFGSWLYLWPDGETREECAYDFGDRESFEELQDKFFRTYKHYHADGLYDAAPEVVEYAHSVDRKLGLAKIENLAPVKPNVREAFECAVAGDIFNAITTPEKVDKIIILDVSDEDAEPRKIFQGCKDDMPLNVVGSPCKSFDVADGYLSCNIDSDIENTNRPLNKALECFSDEKTDKVLIWDQAKGEEVFSGTKADACSKFGNCEFISFETPAVIRININNPGILSADEIEGEKQETDINKLVKKIIDANNLSQYKTDKPNTNEYWIKACLEDNEDVELIYESFVKPTENKELIKEFKAVTGYNNALEEAYEAGFAAAVAESTHKTALKESRYSDEMREFYDWIQEYNDGALWDAFTVEFDSEQDPDMDEVLSWLEDFDEDAYYDYIDSSDGINESKDTVAKFAQVAAGYKGKGAPMKLDSVDADTCSNCGGELLAVDSDGIRKCQSCGNKYVNGQPLFCTKCGSTEIDVAHDCKCKSCGTEFLKDAQCPECGGELVDGKCKHCGNVAEAVDLDQVKAAVEAEEATPEADPKAEPKTEESDNKVNEGAYSGGYAQSGGIDNSKRAGGPEKKFVDALAGKKTRTVKAKDLKSGDVTSTGEVVKVTSLGWDAYGRYKEVEVNYGGIGTRGSLVTDRVPEDREYQILDEAVATDRKFKVGDELEYTGVMTGLHVNLEVTKVTDDYLVADEVWIAEDTGKTCRSPRKFGIEQDDAGNDCIVVWEYHGEVGRVYPPAKIATEACSQTRSFKTRKELAEAVEECKNNSRPYTIRRSTVEGYRYDLVTEAINEEVEPDDEVTSLVPATEGEIEIVDDIPQQMPAEYTPQQRQLMDNIHRIAIDISDSIQRHYDIEADPQIIVADIIRDLQLISGDVSVEDLGNSAADRATAELFRSYQEFYNFVDTVISDATGTPFVTTPEAKIRQAIQMLHGPNFRPENIDRMIGSTAFIAAARSGNVPYIAASDLPLLEELEDLLAEGIDLDTDMFDEEMNSYFNEAYDETVVYTTTGGHVNQDGTIMLEGLIQYEEAVKPITFTLTPENKITEEVEDTDAAFEQLMSETFTVTNNISEEVFEFKFSK